MYKIQIVIVVLLVGILHRCRWQEIGSEPHPGDLPPGELPDPDRTLVDADSSIKAYENRTISGDNFLNNLYERPFTSQEMVYQPDLDIITVDFSTDEDFFYFTINLYGMNPVEWGLNGMYGVEFDRTLTGRGDLIVWAENMQKEWSLENVSAYIDENGDVGGQNPMLVEQGFKGNGYDRPFEMKGNKVAFARISPDDPEAVQFAVSHALLDDPTEFLWGVWADNGLKDVTRFDYNDTMGPSAAGSPINTNDDYPLGDLFNLDNTCRLPYGVGQMGTSYRGMCITQAPAPEPDAPNCVTTCLRPGAYCTTVCN